MTDKKSNQAISSIEKNEQWDINQLIDLFVDMNFEDIYNKTLIFQFKIVAHRIGYPPDMVSKVVDLGMTEYKKMMEEIKFALENRVQV